LNPEFSYADGVRVADVRSPGRHQAHDLIQGHTGGARDFDGGVNVHG
jgi:hypothetical protein